MTMKRCAIAFFALAVGVMMAFAFFSLAFPSGVTKAGFDRVDLGMTKPEVETIFQRAPSETWQNMCGGKDKSPIPRYESTWEGAGTAIIGFDDGGHVVSKQWTEKSVLEKLKAFFTKSEPTFTTVGQ